MQHIRSKPSRSNKSSCRRNIGTSPLDLIGFVTVCLGCCKTLQNARKAKRNRMTIFKALQFLQRHQIGKRKTCIDPQCLHIAIANDDALNTKDRSRDVSKPLQRHQRNRLMRRVRCSLAEFGYTHPDQAELGCTRPLGRQVRLAALQRTA